MWKIHDLFRRDRVTVRALAPSAALSGVVRTNAIRYAVACTLASLAIVSFTTPIRAQPMPGGMPDLRAISGKALPDRGMATGTVTVRVARGAPSNAVASTEVVAIVEGPSGESRKRTAKTDTGGRAFFEGLPAGHKFQAQVVVDGENLATDSFVIPDVGGIRTMLIAGLAAGGGDNAAPAAEADADGAPAKGKAFALGIISGTVNRDPALPAGAVHVLALDEQGAPLVGKMIELGHVRPGGQVEVTRQVTGSDGTTRFLGIGGSSAKAADGKSADVGAAVVMEHGQLRLGTDGFSLPATDGVQVQLRVPARTADPSVISIGAGGRVILQLRDDNVSFIETLPLENHTDKLYDPGPGGIEIPLPSEFTSADVAEGEHKIEIRKGIGVAVHGLIPPRRPQATDTTHKSPDEVTFGFLLPQNGSTRSFDQPFPNGLGEFTFVTDQIPGLTVESAQITGRQDRELGGKKYWLMRGAPVPPGGRLQFTVRGLPAPDNTGRTVAAVLALALVAAAIAFGRRGGGDERDGRANDRDKLVQRREKLFAELVAFENRGTTERDGRRDLIQRLESVYREIASLDERRRADIRQPARAGQRFHRPTARTDNRNSGTERRWKKHAAGHTGHIGRAHHGPRGLGER
jgi:hypothetical protein